MLCENSLRFDLCARPSGLRTVFCRCAGLFALGHLWIVIISFHRFIASCVWADRRKCPSPRITSQIASYPRFRSETSIPRKARYVMACMSSSKMNVSKLPPPKKAQKSCLNFHRLIYRLPTPQLTRSCPFQHHIAHQSLWHRSLNSQRQKAGQASWKTAQINHQRPVRNNHRKAL